jgi:hypothetical protein
MIHSLVPNHIVDIRATSRLKHEVETYMEKWTKLPVNARGQILSKSKRKPNSFTGQVIPFAHVFFADHLGWHVRIGLPKALKQFAGSRYGVSKSTWLPNGFEYVGAESMEEAAGFVAKIREWAIEGLESGDYRHFMNWLDAGDGSHRYYNRSGAWSKHLSAM